ncbi:hypothetical protein CXG81DRAFT_13317 [Caulochytrium protostelioides]|uniref:General substrate transporter n=1 Tax=Caulochytrium protostelioides TaxID=1555241 RepID=A0A4P9X5I3_9FUNG|nr:general substrate transporter [Caulochytrium protostelioides]RKP00376.1 hypothetical protein CXG81DRAFT_13317 [Caulochytrium protostelioides]|eukprot:RKP00376.1 hypothetical protein CXG81DRAFT_13317 [Caulochytrium protostelioides]
MEGQTYLFYCVGVGLLSAFQFGYTTAVVNAPEQAMTNCALGSVWVNPMARLPTCFAMDDWSWGAFVSGFLFAGIVGGLAGGHLAARFGRRRILLFSNIPNIIGALLIGLAPSIGSLIAGRVFQGLGMGVGTVVLPLYIAELAPTHLRGTLGSCNQLIIMLGVLVSQAFGIAWSVPHRWRWLFLYQALPGLVQLALLPSTVESPRWLASNGFINEARIATQRLRGPGVDVDEELFGVSSRVDSHHHHHHNDVVATEGAAATATTTTAAAAAASPRESWNDDYGDQDEVPVTLQQVFARPNLCRPVVYAFILQLAQQGSGINAAIFFSTRIFSSKFTAETAVKLSLLTSVVNVVMTIVTLPLIEKQGRRTLLLASSIGMGMCSLMLAVSSFGGFDSAALMVFTLMTFTGSYGLGLGSIPWLIFPEIVPARATAAASGLCTAINWAGAALVGLVLPSAIGAVGYNIFFFFAACMGAMIVFVLRVLPETKGRTPEELQATVFNIR